MQMAPCKGMGLGEASLTRNGRSNTGLFLKALLRRWTGGGNNVDREDGGIVSSVAGPLGGCGPPRRSSAAQTLHVDLTSG